MKRMTDSEKIVVIARAINNAFSTQDIAAIIDCPYGDATHVGVAPLVPERCCATCSKLDGSECVDEFLEAKEAAEVAFASVNKGEITIREYNVTNKRTEAALQAVRDWRAKR